MPGSAVPHIRAGSAHGREGAGGRRAAHRRYRGLVLAVALLLALAAAVAGRASASASAVAGAATTGVPAYCQTGGSQLWSNLATCGWPAAQNTGFTAATCPGGKLAQRGQGNSEIVLATANESITCTEFNGRVIIRAPHVTITNSAVTTRGHNGSSGSGSIVVDVGASATIDHVTVDGGNSVHACIWDQGLALTVQAVNCYKANDGVFTWAISGKPGAGDHFAVENSFFHDFTQATANGHDDGYQTEGNSDGVIQHDTFRMSANSTSAVAVWNSRESAENITVDDNLITGGGFAVYAQDYNPGDGAPGNPSAAGGFSVTNIQFVNNSFSTFAAACVGKYGVWFDRPSWVPYKGGPTDGWHRQGNVVLETGEKVDNANPHKPSGDLCR